MSDVPARTGSILFTIDRAGTALVTIRGQPGVADFAGAARSILGDTRFRPGRPVIVVTWNSLPYLSALELLALRAILIDMGRRGVRCIAAVARSAAGHGLVQIVGALCGDMELPMAVFRREDDAWTWANAQSQLAAVPGWGTVPANYDLHAGASDEPGARRTAGQAGGEFAAAVAAGVYGPA